MTQPQEFSLDETEASALEDTPTTVWGAYETPKPAASSAPPERQSAAQAPAFVPPVPKSLTETGLPILLVEDLIFKLLLGKGVLSGKEIAASLCLPFTLLNPFLGDLKTRLLLAHRSSTGLGDFLYMLTEQGRERALMAREVSAYVGAAPVPFADYLKSIQLQSIRNETPTLADLKEAFADMIFDEALFDTIGPAINSGRGLFLYGVPGNGKTSIAERIVRCFKNHIFIPRALFIDGEIIQLFDPQSHSVVTPSDESEASPFQYFDTRWVYIERPAIIVGGELTMEALEIKFNPLLKVCEAPLQLKANGGLFLIDDFGRQRMHHEELLNRWIVPLEKRMDFLTLPNGKKISVPFDELIVFSTNLDPKDLVDEAFLRRIPYKINVVDPTREQFKQLFQLLCPRYGVPYDEASVDYLITHHYDGKRPFRACQPRDLLEQIVNTCRYLAIPPVMKPEYFDAACQNYFSAMGSVVVE